MKKTIVILLSVALLLSLAGCRSVTPSGSSSVLCSPSSEAQSAASSANPSAMTATNGTPENHITYLHDFRYYPVSYMKQGVQKLTGDGGWLEDVEKVTAKAPPPGSLKEHSVKEMYVNQETVPDVKEKEYPYLTYSSICSNGNWDLFPTKVRYESYTADNQPNKPEWDEYIKKLISDRCDNTPVIYVNAWFFDWNGDGIEDAYVNASNIIYSNKYQYPNPPYYDNTGVYLLTVLFLSGSDPIFRDRDIEFHSIGKDPLAEDDIVTYYNSVEYIDEWYTDDTYLWVSIQYDSKGNLTYCPIYESGYWADFWKNEIILCDIDGDGKSELITTNSGEYCAWIVYKLINGKPTEVFNEINW